MSRSLLCHKISLLELVEGLNDNQCLDVIRLLQNELGHPNLTEMVKKLIMISSQSLTKTSLIEIENTIKNKYSQCRANINIKQLQTSPNKTDNTNKNNRNNKKNKTFPLDRLPVDLISKTSFNLNEKDIFKFEQCCRLFYKIVNNSSYLSKCNNFKRFLIRKKRLLQMKQAEYSFFKYTKSNELTFDFSGDYNNQWGRIQFNDIVTDFKTALEMQTRAGYDNCMTQLFKSISTLNLSEQYSWVVLSQLPIDILFNPDWNESHLTKIELNHAYSSYNQSIWNKHMHEFENKYLKFDKKLKQEKKKIKTLDCIKHIDRSCVSGNTWLSNPRYIYSKHVWLDGINVDLKKNNYLTNEYNPHVKMITLRGRMQFFVNDDESISNDIISHKNRGLQIQTLRLLNQSVSFDSNSFEVCNKQNVIEAFGLDKNLKNLTIEFNMLYETKCQSYSSIYDKVIKNIFEKKFYYKLENVNILFKISDADNLDWIFTLLKKNCKILKYQFKQLNIGLCKICEQLDNILQLYYILQWNSKIDERVLHQAKAAFDQMRPGDQGQMQLQEKYCCFLRQWID